MKLCEKQRLRNGVLYFSGNDYTHVYGASKDEGNYTPHIADCFSPHVTSCILDGEMVGFNAETKTIGSVWFLSTLECYEIVKIRQMGDLSCFLYNVV